MGEKKKTARADNKALYRTYRPKSLDEIIGQEHVTVTLKNALEQGKTSHAYLFTGPRGTGKTSIARILAHEINNIPYTDDSTNLDIIEIDAASNRRIDDIRELRDKVNIAPVSAQYKVYIIDEVHMLTTESFNALLKTLEEPPAHVVFILATTELHKLPATIISRTQRHSFRLVSQAKVAEHLRHIAQQESIVIDDESLELLAIHGGGSFRDSISLLDQLSAHSEPITKELVQSLFGLASQSHLQELLNHTLNGDSSQIITQLEVLEANGLTPGAIANQLVSLLRKNLKSGEGDERHVGVMTKLLSVQTAQFPLLILETILLAVAPTAVKVAPNNNSAPTAPLPEKQEKTQETQPKSKSPKVTELTQPEPVAEEPQVQEQLESKKSPKEVRDTLEKWPQILEATKKQNNPLYTVLRLATPEVTPEGLLLIFAFPFHQKKIDEVKYKTIISQIVQDVSGQNLAITTLVDKSRVKPAGSLSSEAAPDPAHASLIGSVQDIMGGGEVVNV